MDKISAQAVGANAVPSKVQIQLLNHRALCIDNLHGALNVFRCEPARIYRIAQVRLLWCVRMRAKPVGLQTTVAFSRCNNLKKTLGKAFWVGQGGVTQGAAGQVVQEPFPVCRLPPCQKVGRSPGLSVEGILQRAPTLCVRPLRFVEGAGPGPWGMCWVLPGTRGGANAEAL